MKAGYTPRHLKWTAQELSAKADEISEVAQDLRSISVVFEFERVDDLE